MRRVKNLYKGIATTLIVLVISTTSSLGGGKCLIPVDSPILPIPLPATVSTYIGIGLISSGIVRVCECAVTRELKDITYGASIRAGWNYNDYIGLEVRLINAPLEKDFTTTKSYGLFIKPQYKITPTINVYGVLGYSKSEIEGAGDKNYNTLFKSGFSYGAGVEYTIFKDWSIWVDYQNLFYNEGVFNLHTNIFSVGILRHF